MKNAIFCPVTRRCLQTTTCQLASHARRTPPLSDKWYRQNVTVCRHKWCLQKLPFVKQQGRCSQQTAICQATEVLPAEDNHLSGDESSTGKTSPSVKWQGHCLQNITTRHWYLHKPTIWQRTETGTCTTGPFHKGQKLYSVPVKHYHPIKQWKT